MNKKLLKRIFPLIALLLLAPWPIAYTHDAGAAADGQETVRIEIAEASAQPTWTAFGKAIGGVTPGDLFHIDATDNSADIQVTLYLTNAQELIHNYRYMILKVGIYVQSDAGEWKKAFGNDVNSVPNTFVTLRNGEASFTLMGNANYKVTIDSGSFNCITTNAVGGSLSPQFLLEAD